MDRKRAANRRGPEGFPGPGAAAAATYPRAYYNSSRACLIHELGHLELWAVVRPVRHLRSPLARASCHVFPVHVYLEFVQFLGWWRAAVYPGPVHSVGSLLIGYLFSIPTAIHRPQSSTRSQNTP
jgi:hypothetical protein